MQKLTDAQDLIADARKLAEQWHKHKYVSIIEAVGTVTDLAAALESVTAEYAAWREGKRGVEEHLALIEENKRLKAEISEMRERDRWIPVVEKLPEESGKYLARINRTAIDELGGNSDFVRIKMFMGGEWAYGTHSPAWINGQLKDTVTHWRPLPSTETKGAD